MEGLLKDDSRIQKAKVRKDERDKKGLRGEPDEGEAALKKSRLETIEEQALTETDVDMLAVLYDDHKRLTEETQENEGAEPPQKEES